MTKNRLKYDPEIIQMEAEYLYACADYIERFKKLVGTAAGAGVGLVLGAGVGLVLGAGFGPLVGAGGLVGLLAGGWRGARLGKRLAAGQAFELKLQAQTALCQVKIEQNTRPA